MNYCHPGGCRWRWSSRWRWRTTRWRRERRKIGIWKVHTTNSNFPLYVALVLYSLALSSLVTWRKWKQFCRLNFTSFGTMWCARSRFLWIPWARRIFHHQVFMIFSNSLNCATLLIFPPLMKFWFTCFTFFFVVVPLLSQRLIPWYCRLLFWYKITIFMLLSSL